MAHFREYMVFGGAVLAIFLRYFNKNNHRLFLGGFIIGSIVEYVISLLGELIFHVKWWDYSNMPLNINGRICVYFSIFWGFLAVYFMSYIHPKIERLIEWFKTKISVKVLKGITLGVTIFLFLDCILTGYALNAFFVRKVHDYDLNVPNEEYYIAEYDRIYGSKTQKKIIDTFFNDKKMIKTFPNLKTKTVDGEIIYFDCYVNGISPYYYVFSFSKFKN